MAKKKNTNGNSKQKKKVEEMYSEMSDIHQENDISKLQAEENPEEASEIDELIEEFSAKNADKEPAPETSDLIEDSTETGETNKIQELTEENSKLRDQMLRQIAEFENYKKRRAQEIDIISTASIESMTLDMVGVLDDLDLLIKNTDVSSKAGKALLEGAKLIRQKLFD
ncbi:nucleotide exchange factor GrpE, partial [bacterium]|nr:nucleotide exchange factor GrpE [bacterium]